MATGFSKRNPTWAGVLTAMMPQPLEGEVASRSGRWVYFLHFPELRRVKIGTSGNPERRPKQLDAQHRELRGFERTLVGKIDGGQPVEHLIHKRFSDQRIRGEWFHDSILTEVRDLIAKDEDHYGLDDGPSTPYSPCIRPGAARPESG